MTPRRHGVEPELTVVIPTLGRMILRRSLEALAACDPQPARVIVVDQGSREDIADMVSEFDARGLRTCYVPTTSTGRAAGVNRGMERVETRFVALTDDDCLAAPDWVGRLAARLREHPGAIVTGRVFAGDGDVVSVVTSETPVIQRRPSLRFDRMSGGNVGMPTELRTSVGPFDEDPCVRTAEDVEFSYRALRRGVAIVYAPDVVVTHLGWRDAGERVSQYQDYARSHGGFFGKYLRRGDGFVAIRAALHLLRAARRWLFGRLRGNREVALNGRAYVLGLLPGIVAGWRSALPLRRAHLLVREEVQ